jgi:N-acetylglucosaminyldiphosphoundecaprenol N-acetyl-beta-D-mannosaminyltransferase
MSNERLLEHAPLTAVLRGEAPWVGSRLDPDAPRGWVSPVEARVQLGLHYGDMRTLESERLRARSPLRDASTVVTALVSRAVAPTAEAPRPERPWVVSSRVDNLTTDDALDTIFALPQRERARIIHFVHPHALNLASDDGVLARDLSAADAVLADGVGLQLAARVLGFELRSNVNGTDLLPLLCERAVKEGVPVVLVGGAPEVAEACRAKLLEAHPGLSIPWVSNGFLDAEASRDVAERVRATGRCIVLVGMGSPRQERWTWEHLAEVDTCTAVTVGGLFDFYSGHVPRAPAAWRELGVEWVWRLRQEPRRLAKRYLVGNPLFVLRVVRQRLAT